MVGPPSGGGGGGRGGMGGERGLTLGELRKIGGGTEPGRRDVLASRAARLGSRRFGSGVKNMVGVSFLLLQAWIRKRPKI